MNYFHFKKSCLVTLFIFISFYGIGQDVFFNEVNYKVPSGEDQIVEIAGPTGTNLTGWQVIVYDENSDQTGSYPLGGIIPANGGPCTGIIEVDGAVLNVTAGSGIAIINNQLQVEQYLTFETSTTAPANTGSPIAGMTSEFIPIADTEEVKKSVQLVGDAVTAFTFTWTLQTETGGEINTGQTFPPCFLVALPVELINFVGNGIGKNIELQWHTASEVDHSHFEIMHSFDGNEFEKIGEVSDATRINSTLKQYDFVFETPKVGGNYFRLNQVDLDGTTTKTNIIYVSFKGFEQQVSIYPNPAREKIRVVLDQNIDADKVWIQLMNVQGKMLLNKKMDSINISSIDISKLETGMYFLRIFSQEQQWETVFVKEE